MKKLYMKSLISLVLILAIGLLQSQDVVAQEVNTKSIEIERLFFDDLEAMLKQIMVNQDVYQFPQALGQQFQQERIYISWRRHAY